MSCVCGSDETSPVCLVCAGQTKDQCYPVSEALYHLLGGKKAGWKPVVIHMGGGQTHWVLRHTSGFVLDATALQFVPWLTLRMKYGRGSGFLTKRPSKRARALIKQLTTP